MVTARTLLSTCFDEGTRRPSKQARQDFRNWRLLIWCWVVSARWCSSSGVFPARKVVSAQGIDSAQDRFGPGACSLRLAPACSSDSRMVENRTGYVFDSDRCGFMDGVKQAPSLKISHSWHCPKNSLRSPESVLPRVATLPPSSSVPMKCARSERCTNCFFRDCHFHP